MYFVDRNKIEKTLLYMEGLLREFQQHQYNSFTESLALERITQMIIESMIDVGNMMIDGFIMRDPGSYEDIIDILVDEKVLPEAEIDQYKEIFMLRKELVRDYLNVNHDHLKEVLLKQNHSLEQFSTRIRNYLDKELGPVSAFSN